MAINPSTQYPGQSAGPTANYPLGAAIDVSAPGLTDGTPYDEAFINDIWGFLQAAITESGVIPSGAPDTALASDYLDALKLIFPSGTVSPGTVSFTAAAIAHPGSLMMDGAAISRTTYADLFAAIGTTYGIGDGSTTFNIPDARGLFPRYQDLGAGIDPDAASRTDRGDGTTGDAVGTKQGDELGAHEHINGLGTSAGKIGGLNLYGFASGFNSSNSTRDEGANGTTSALTETVGGLETRPSNIYFVGIIKY